MLPSTGYFKGINCPFYDSGLCERPYCHFRHVKKEPQSVSNDGIESGEILQKLVSAAVQKVLQQTDTSSTSPTRNNSETEQNTHPVLPKATYNPTPIAELNKINNVNEDNEELVEQKRRHIPVPYTPRKPASLPIKRPADTNGTQLFTYLPPAKYNPGSETAQLDPYTPKGSSESKEKYMPGSETTIPEYTLNETKNSKVNYIPSDRNTSKKKILEYKPIKVKNQQTSLKYQPTPKALVPCFSSDEDEPIPKKAKLSHDLNGLDDLGPEFDILDQILDDEKDKNGKDISAKDSKECKENEQSSKETKVSKNKKTDLNKMNKDRSDKNHSKSKDKTKEGSRDKSKEQSRQKSRERDNSKNKRREKSQERSIDKSSGKSSTRDKKSSSDKKTSHSSSRDGSRSHSKEKSDKKSTDKSSSKSSKHSRSSSSKHNKDEKTTDRNHKSNRSSKESNKKTGKHKKETDNSQSDNEDHNYEEIVEDELNDLSESDEEKIAEECKRIFEEFVPTEKVIKNEPEKVESESEEDLVVSSKKRISRTIEKNIKILPKTPLKPDFKSNAAQTMAERLTKVREFHASKNAPENTVPTNVSSKPDLIKPNVNTKIRIAHVPYASTLLSAKKVIPPITKLIKPADPSTSTSIQTVKKGTQRVAHVPNEKFIDRPGVLEPLGSKIPANIRSTYLNMMIDHCLKIYLSSIDAYNRAQNEELATSKKCSTVQIYKNSAVLTISRLKKELQECNGVKKSGENCSALQKSGSQGVSKTSNTGSWSIENKNRNNSWDTKELSGAKLYNNIKKWILTEEQLKENGFPRPHSSGQRGRAIIYGQNKQNPPKGFVRTCCRCKKNYTVDKKGFAAVKEECIYHPNNKYRVRGEARYQCCGQDSTSDGCCMATSHVFEYVDFENLKGYVKTLPPDKVMDDYGIYSLDCEMCYTTHGLDLTRVTIIDSACKVVYETLIKPLHPIIDYNTRYSGITEDQMSNVTTTLLEVQATLLTMFSSKTILIGHSLESDFKALKLIHDTVIDTSVVFPHKMGPPYKRALRNLSSEYLKKIIQNSVDGHDSAEDATVCMELILYKVKEDLKTR